MTRRSVATTLLAAALSGCGAKNHELKRYAMEGEVKALDAASKLATIKHGQIGDWMEPMTMEFQVKPESEFAKLHVGDQITATVVVDDLTYHITDIKVSGKP